ncbi:MULTISPECIES: SDR family NAD(P)-dependent oxidoreductase [unclassified Pseudomonas]|uniref:SDR family NAD(P)-dependent oxidoreductase n=1 Tax=unclassified Pseudomonas TaxID=196821 RepID=UPI003850CA33
MFKTQKGTAVVTGASTGIGEIYAERLADRGYDLILVARNRAKLNQTAARISDRTGRAVEVAAADLADPTDLLRIEQILKQDASITLLVNNAGVGATAPLVQADVDEMTRMVALNVTAVMRLTYAVIPGMVARGEGTVVNIASIVALAPDILNGVYGGSKAFVMALTQSLHHELHDKNIRVQAVLPGATSTQFWDAAGLPVSNLPDSIVMSAADMVDASLAALDAGEVITLPSLPDIAHWHAFEQAVDALRPYLSLAQPAPRLWP